MRTRVSNTPPVAVAQVASAADFFSTPPQYVVISPDENGATVHLSGAGSHDPDGDPLSFLWSARVDDRTTVELARTQEAAVRLALGQHHLTLTVSDGTDESTRDIYVQVISASEAIEAMVGLAEESLADRHHHVLVVLLRKAQRAIEHGQIHSALHRLARLEKQIAVWLANTHPDLAESLVAAIRDIRAALEAPSG